MSDTGGTGLKRIGASKGLEKSQMGGVGRTGRMEGFGGRKFGCSEIVEGAADSTVLW